MVRVQSSLPQDFPTHHRLPASVSPGPQTFRRLAERSRSQPQPQQPCPSKRLKLDVGCQASSSSSQSPASRLKAAAAATEAPPASEGPSTSETGGRGRRGPKRAPSPDDVAPGLPVVRNPHLNLIAGMSTSRALVGGTRVRCA